MMLGLGLSFCLSLGFIFAQENKSYTVEELYELPIEKLLEVGVHAPAAITNISIKESPASITSISADDILRSPARNIYDLLEIHVPGAIWLNYEEGPLIGLRGSVINRNFKYLLLLNGRIMNSKGMHGAKSELEQWDMSDIKRIDFIRGPGSVTYGPGAVSGVINIVTHNARSMEGSRVSARYVTEYDSKGFALSHGYTKKNHNLYSHLSITRTKGTAAPQFMGTNSPGAGYIGVDIKQNEEVLDYFADFQDRPQIKFYIESEFQKHWKLWGRYISEGSTWRGNEVKSDFSGDKRNQQSIQDRQATVTLEHKKDLSVSKKIHSIVSFDSFDAERRIERVSDPDPDHVRNKKSNYSEDEINIKTILNSVFSKKFEIAFGAEYSHDRFGPGWGDGPEDMRIGGDGIIVSDANSNAIGPKLSVNEAVFAGDGWTTHSFAIFKESYYALDQKNKLLVSGRLDKSTDSSWLFSPRLAYMKTLKKNHLLKFIAQKSVRRNIAGQVFVESQRGKKSSDEDIVSYELIYNGNIKKNINLEVSTFINDAEVIAWDSNIDEVVPIGELKLFGLESCVKYKLRKGSFSLSYSLTKQLSWDLEAGKSASGISYSDYSQSLSGSTAAVMQGYGNDLNNWPNQSIKFNFLRQISKRLSFHANGQLYWDYQGGRDGLAALSQAAAGDALESDVIAAINRAKDENAYDLDFRLNLSLDYQINKKTELILYAHNVLGPRLNKRYSYDSGMSKFSPHKLRFVKEDRAFSMNLIKKF